ncbi:MAG: CheY-P-specific phosphatase CheC [Lachnospiraceae bacterium]|nr:CheY-P-specific phosphatase CheC [Lachnospiraceae bacterium]
MKLENINEMQFDVLKEIGNIGAGNATTALAKLINSKLDMKVPKVQMVGFQDLATVMGSEEHIMVAVLVTLSDDVEGMMMFLMDVKSAKYLISQMLKSMGMEMPIDENAEFSEMELSVVSELGNIISGSYLAALSSLLQLVINISVPYVSVDMAGAILSVPAIEFGKVGDQVLLIETKFGDDEISGYFILIPEEESYEKIMKALGM